MQGENLGVHEGWEVAARFGIAAKAVNPLRMRFTKCEAWISDVPKTVPLCWERDHFTLRRPRRWQYVVYGFVPMKRWPGLV